jgi:hypothetical protein
MPDVPDTLMAAQISGTLSDPGRPEGSPLPSHVVPMGFNLDGLRIEDGGLHALVVEIDGKEVLRRGFAVIVAEPAPA